MARDEKRTPGDEALRRVLIEYAHQDALTPEQKAQVFERVKDQVRARSRSRTWYIPAAAAASAAVLGLSAVLTLYRELPDGFADLRDQPRFHAPATESLVAVVAIGERKLKQLLIAENIPYRFTAQDGKTQLEAYIGTPPSAGIEQFLIEHKLRRDAYGRLRLEITE